MLGSYKIFESYKKLPNNYTLPMLIGSNYTKHNNSIQKVPRAPKETASNFSLFLFPPRQDSINQCSQKDSNLRSRSYIFAHYSNFLFLFWREKRATPHIFHARFCLDGRKMIQKTRKKVVSSPSVLQLHPILRSSAPTFFYIPQAFPYKVKSTYDIINAVIWQR